MKSDRVPVDLRLKCYSYLGCPVNQKSCNISSSLPEGNNILVIENAYTPTECAGIGVTKSKSIVVNA